jgi:hypothetical protein
MKPMSNMSKVCGCDAGTCSTDPATRVKTNTYKCRKRRRLTEMALAALAPMVWLVLMVPAHCQKVTEFNQTVITDKVTFSLDQSPYLITDDVIVQRTGIY